MNRLFTCLALLLCLAFVHEVRAQSIAGGLIYQAAAEGGVDYVNPTSGQAIINQKAALNWKNILGSALSDGSIGVLTAGLANVFPLSKAVEVALAAGHTYYDHSIAPILAGAAPNPNDIPPVLQMAASMSPGPTACAENSIYATRAPKTYGPVMINGLSVTYAAQGVQVVKHIDGSKLKQFQVVDVLVCLPGNVVPPPAPAPSVVPSAKKAVSWIPAGELLALNQEP